MEKEKVFFWFGFVFTFWVHCSTHSLKLLWLNLDLTDAPETGSY